MAAIRGSSFDPRAGGSVTGRCFERPEPEIHREIPEITEGARVTRQRDAPCPENPPNFVRVHLSAARRRPPGETTVPPKSSRRPQPGGGGPLNVGRRRWATPSTARCRRAARVPRRSHREREGRDASGHPGSSAVAGHRAFEPAKTRTAKPPSDTAAQPDPPPVGEGKRGSCL